MFDKQKNDMVPTENKKEKLDVKEDENTGQVEEDLRYGCGCWKPKWLQFFNKAGWYTFFIFFTNFFQGLVVNGLVGVVLSTLERRFSLTSVESSWIASVYDVASVPFIIATIYIGARCHRPFWTGFGQFMVMFGTILFALPHFTTDNVYLGDSNLTDDGLCLLNLTEPRPEAGENFNAGLQGYLGVFITARILHGIGITPLYTVTVTFLDDISTNDQFSLYVVIFFIGGVLGPASAAAVGGLLLNVFTDFYAVDVDSIGLTPDDPRWIGNWWMGFLIGAVLLFFAGFPLIGYPRDLPGAEKVRAEKKTEAHGAEGSDLDSGIDLGLSFAQTPSYLKTVCTNPTFVSIIFYVCCDLALTAGFSAFGPKIIEVIMSMSPATAGMVFGVISIPGGILGLLLGGAIIKKFQLSCTGILKMCTASTVCFLACIFILFVECDQYLFAGVNAPYANESLSGFDASCNSFCSCEDVPFKPICGVDNVQYFSPCHAGCDSITIVDDQPEEYFNCSCIMDPFRNVSSPDATSERCETPGCPTAIGFYVGFLIAMMFMFLCTGSLVSVVVRCVPSTHRSLGIGLQILIPKLIAGPLGPLVFGLAIDNSCSLWGDDGACLWYDVPRLRSAIFTIMMVLKVVSLIGLIIGTVLYKSPPEEATEDMVITSENVEEMIDVNGLKQLTTKDYTAKDNAAFVKEAEVLQSVAF